MSENVVSKNKANYQLMLLVQKETNYQEIIAKTSKTIPEKNAFN